MRRWRSASSSSWLRSWLTSARSEATSRPTAAAASATAVLAGAGWVCPESLELHVSARYPSPLAPLPQGARKAARWLRGGVFAAQFFHFLRLGERVR